MRMGRHSLEKRNFFEEDQEFPDQMKRILDGYNEAARMAAVTASHAVRFGTLEALREAQWWEAVAQTIEQCLSVVIDEEDEEVDFSMPTPPEFDIA